MNFPNFGQSAQYSDDDADNALPVEDEEDEEDEFSSDETGDESRSDEDSEEGDERGEGEDDPALHVEELNAQAAIEGNFECVPAVVNVYVLR